MLSPPLFVGGPAGTMQIEAGLQGTGINTFTVHAEPTAGNTAAATPAFFLGTTNVTAAVLAGTEVITCYAAPVGCPPMHAVLTPSGSGAGGSVDMEIILQSTIDGQGTQVFIGAQVAGTVGPDLSTSLPNLGVGVYESTPVTQIVSQADGAVGLRRNAPCTSTTTATSPTRSPCRPRTRWRAATPARSPSPPPRPVSAISAPRAT